MENVRIQTKDIQSKWPKFSSAELANVKSHDSLSALVAKAYSLDKAKADADVTTWLAGRSF